MRNIKNILKNFIVGFILIAIAYIVLRNVLNITINLIEWQPLIGLLIVIILSNIIGAHWADSVINFIKSLPMTVKNLVKKLLNK